MEKLQQKLTEIPKQPGVYQFLNKDGGVIYVGKAKNLKSRVGQYFTGHDNRPQLPYLMAEAVDVNYTVVNSELESAFLENTLIKQYAPKYNIDLKDDKNYAFITIDYSTEIPQIGYARKIDDGRRHSESRMHLRDQESQSKKKRSFTRMRALRMTPKTKYFGPYSAAYKIRNTLNLVRRIFPYCAAQKVGNRPCFYYYMHRCPGVCIGKISLNDYKKQLDRIGNFLQGDIGKIKRQLTEEMRQAAVEKKFELAARLRDQCRDLEILEQRQAVILNKNVDWDIVSLAESDGYACINLFKIRGGKMFDKENFVYELPAIPRRHSAGVQPTEESLQSNEKEILHPSDALGVQNDASSEVLQRFLEQYYLETSSRPACVYLQSPPEDSELIEHILRSRFGKKTEITVPQKNQPKSLINLGKLNAEEYLKNWLRDKAGNLDKINKALEQLKEVLGLDAIPKRIECYDISNTQGTNPVGSMVVFTDGLPAKSQYRKFKIQGKKTPDDFAMMKEMLSRRFAKLQSSPPAKGEYLRQSGGEGVGATSNTPTTPSASQPPLLGKEGKTEWPAPDLIVIDGGKGQLGVAIEILKSIPYPLSPIPLIGLAKRVEEIFLPEVAEPIILAHDQPALQLLQRLRDEAHRFGITFHRQLRSKQAVKSALDDIAGIGPKTKKLLKQKFGTVAQIRKTSFNELAAVVGEKMAQIIQQSL